MTKQNTSDLTFSFQAGKPVTGSQLAGREVEIQQIVHHVILAEKITEAVLANQRDSYLAGLGIRSRY
jgi:hypothetical protein